MKNENLILKIYSITVTLILAFVFLTGLKSNILNQKFEEITVQRINIVEPDGQLKMVISNQARQHPGMIDGKVFQKRERAPGILFFNEEQDEVGALGYHGSKDVGGNQVFLSFDQYKNDQVMQLMHYSDKNGDNRYGLQLWERDKELTQPERIHIFDSLDKAGFNYPQKLEYLKAIHGGQPVSAPRMFVGRYYDSKTGLFIQDKYGTDRLRFYVDSDNSPKIELLDEKGRIIKDILID
jgi:hypothetical protein